MSRILMILGLCFMALPFFLLGDAYSVQVSDRKWEGSATQQPEQRASGLAREQNPEDRLGSMSLERIPYGPAKERPSLRLWIQDFETEALMAPVRVRIFSVGEERTRLFHEETVVDKREIRLPLPRGPLEEWMLDLQVPGYGSQQTGLSECVGETGDEPHVIWLYPGRSFVGRVLASDGRPLGGIDVYADPGGVVWTDPKGEYMLSLSLDEAVDTLSLSVERPGLGAARHEAKLERSTGLRLPDLVLRGDGVLRGRLELVDGKPLSGYRVRAELVHDEDEDQVPQGLQWAEGRSDVRGEFVMRGLAPGKYELSISLGATGADKDSMGRSLGLWPPLETGRSRTLRFHLLDLQVSFVAGSRERQIEVHAVWPGEGRGQGTKWGPGTWPSRITIPVQAGTQLLVEAEALHPNTWVKRLITLDRAEPRQHRLISLPDTSQWVPVTLQVHAPELMKEYSVRVCLWETGQDWYSNARDVGEIRESRRGLFHFFVPPGSQQIQFRIRKRAPEPGICGNGLPRREELPDRIPAHVWMRETQTIQAYRGRGIQLHWRPRLEAVMSFLFELDGDSGSGSVLQKVRVSRRDPSDPSEASGNTVLDKVELESIQVGRAEYYSPEFAAGQYRFCFEVEGFKPMVRDLWLNGGEDRLIRISLTRQRTQAQPRGQ